MLVRFRLEECLFCLERHAWHSSVAFLAGPLARRMEQYHFRHDGVPAETLAALRVFYMNQKELEAGGGEKAVKVAWCGVGWGRMS